MSVADREAVVEKLRAYLGDKLGAEVAVSALERFTVGFSWVTYGFEAAWADSRGPHRESLILRIGPSSGLFAPYRAFPQFAALDVLFGSGVPVPRAYWYEEAGATFGAPFFICAKVGGDVPLPWTTGGEDAFAPPLRDALGEQFVAALAALHRFEWRGTKLAELGRASAETAAAEQIAFWEGVLERWAFGNYPMLRWGISWLRNHRPIAPRVSVVHGDYRTGNFLAAGDRVTAILDWELVHLGDPHEDLGWICLRSFRGRSPYMCQLIERERLYERYQAHSGITVWPQSVRFYEALGTIKLAVIHIGAARAFEEGRYKDVRLATMGIQLPRLLLQIEAVIEDRQP